METTVKCFGLCHYIDEEILFTNWHIFQASCTENTVFLRKEYILSEYWLNIGALKIAQQAWKINSKLGLSEYQAGSCLKCLCAVAGNFLNTFHFNFWEEAFLEVRFTKTSQTNVIQDRYTPRFGLLNSCIHEERNLQMLTELSLS